MKYPDLILELDETAKKIFTESYNTALDSSGGDTEIASEIALQVLQSEYRKINDSWVPKSSVADISFVITKAHTNDQGEQVWMAVGSDTLPDNAGERTSLELFNDWMYRIKHEITEDWIPDNPRIPFLGVAHYPSLQGKAEAGPTTNMYVDGNRFRIQGTFYDNPFGNGVYKSVQKDKEQIKLVQKGLLKSEDVKPIRISAAWWDIQHAHGDYVFTRQSLSDKCPMCEKGSAGNKVYLKGQLDHFAATRIPVNTRTSLTIPDEKTFQEKSMKSKREEDAASIIGKELAAELEIRTRASMSTKSESESQSQETVEGLVIKNEVKVMKMDYKDYKSGGDYLKARREKMEKDVDSMTSDDLSPDMIQQCESNKISNLTVKARQAYAKAMDMEDDEFVEMMDHFHKDEKPKKPVETDQEEKSESGEKPIETDKEEKSSVYKGAMSFEQAQKRNTELKSLQELDDSILILQSVYGTIKESDISSEEKIGLVYQSFGQAMEKIENLLPESSDFIKKAEKDMKPKNIEEIEEEEEEEEKQEMKSELTWEDSPLELFSTELSETIYDKGLDAEQKYQKVQKSMHNLAIQIKSEIDSQTGDPVVQSKSDDNDDRIGSIEKSIAATNQKLDLLFARLDNGVTPTEKSSANEQNFQAIPDNVFPQQKSEAHTQVQQPEQRSLRTQPGAVIKSGANEQYDPTKPMSIRQIARRSTGLQ